jgi:4-hydroxythreonine-4-phosphate dehydrogenase
VDELAAAPGVSRVTVESIPAALDLGNDVLVTVDAGPDVKIKDAPELCAALAARLAPYLPHFGGLVLTGGETARAVLTAARVTALRLLDEVEPGVPLALATGPRVIPVVTKAGAFGDSRTLLRCRAALKITHA